MTIRLTDLTTAQVRMLAFLDDGHNAEDSVGRELNEVAQRRNLAVADRLVKMGLAELRIGPAVGGGISAWYRLSERGRKVRDEGAG